MGSFRILLVLAVGLTFDPSVDKQGQKIDG